MAKKKTSYLPRLEILILLVFFGSFLMWTGTRCNNTQKAFQQAAAAEEREVFLRDSLKKAAELELKAKKIKEAQEKKAEEEQAEIAARTIREQYTPLYVTIKEMNIRKGPTLKSPIIERVKLYDELIFLNEVTDSVETINIGELTATEPWIKIKTPKGKVGWIYGAGVSYYKKELKTEN